MTTPLVARKIRGYGWRRQLPDHRDRHFPMATAPSVVPPRVSLRDRMPPVYDQGNLGSCTANAIAAAFEYDLMRQSLPDFRPSRLALYYGERVIEGTVGTDAGAEIRDGMKVVAKEGVARESLWRYTISKFATKPPATYYAAAKSHVCVEYSAVGQRQSTIFGVLAAGYPIVFGISVYESFESDAVAVSGAVPMPTASEPMLGGHAIVMTGYDLASRTVMFRNSWGEGWGKGGYGTLPLSYVLDPDLSGDFWTLKVVK